MSSAAAGLQDPYRYGSRTRGLWRSALLAAAVHLVLIGVLFVGVRMQNRAPEVVTVELWEPPPSPEPKPVVEAPQPPPPPPAPEVKKEPEPEIKKPDIAVQEKPKPKPKVEEKPPPKVEPKPKPKPAPPKRDVELEKRMKEQLAQEEQRIQQEQQIAAAAREERQLKDLIAKQQAAAQSKALAGWQDKIRAKIRGNIIYDLNRVPGNPEALFDVTLLPTGEVLTVRKIKSSGNAGYDDAVERAIYKSSPLPRPEPASIFQRELKLTFRPQD